MTFHLLGNFEQHVNFVVRALALDHPLHHAPHPTGTFTARRTLTAAFVLIEVGQTGNRFDDVGGVVHHDHGSCTQRGANFTQTVKVHLRITDVFALHTRNGGTTRNNRQQIVPAAAYTTAVLFNQLLEGNAHRFFNGTRLVHVSGNTEQLGTSVVFTTNAGEPCTTALQNSRRNSNGFHVVHCGRAAVDTHVRRERRFQTRLTFFTFKAFQQCSFLTADISPCTVVHVDIKVVAVLVVLADQASIISLINRSLQAFTLTNELTTHVDVSRNSTHRKTSKQTTLNQMVRIMTHDFTVFTGARFGLIRVDHEVGRTTVAFLRHEGPLQTGWEARTTATTKTRGLHFVDDPVTTFFNDFFGTRP